MHGLINYADTKAKWRHLKNWPVKGLCGRCLSKFIDLRYIQSCWYFRPSFVNCCPSNLLSGSTHHSPPPHPVWIKYAVYTYTVCGVAGMGFCWRPYSAGVQHSRLYLTRFRTYEIATPPQTKTWEGRGPQTGKHLPQSSFTGKFFLDDDILIRCLYS